MSWHAGMALARSCCFLLWAVRRETNGNHVNNPCERERRACALRAMSEMPTISVHMIFDIPPRLVGRSSRLRRHSMDASREWYKHGERFNCMLSMCPP